MRGVGRRERWRKRQRRVSCFLLLTTRLLSPISASSQPSGSRWATSEGPGPTTLLSTSSSRTSTLTREFFHSKHLLVALLNLLVSFRFDHSYITPMNNCSLWQYACESSISISLFGSVADRKTQRQTVSEPSTSGTPFTSLPSLLDSLLSSPDSISLSTTSMECST